MTGLARIYAVHIRMCWSDDVSEQVGAPPSLAPRRDTLAVLTRVPSRWQLKWAKG